MSFGGDTEPGEIDLSCPINWDHPDNSGLALCLSAVDGTAGGAKFLNLCRPGDPTAGGTLVNGPTWVGTPWGQWGLRVNGSNQGVLAAIPEGLAAAVCPFSFIAWHRPEAFGIRSVFAQYETTSGGKLVKMIRLDSSRVNYFTVSSSGAYQSITHTQTLTAGRWYRLGVSVHGTPAAPSARISVYDWISGVIDVQSFSLGAIGTPDSTVPLGVGYRPTTGGDAAQGVIADCRFFARGLTVADFVRDADWSRNPATDPRLNRITGRTYFLPPYTATTRKTGYAPWIPGLGW